MPEVEVSGLRIAYEQAGEGPPLVLLHGYVGDARSTWGPQLDALSDAFTVVAWDGPGAGRSDDPPDAFRAWRTSRTASPGSSPRSAWSGRTSPGCRSAAGSRSSSTAAIRSCPAR